MSFFIPPLEVCVPHFRGGRLIRAYASYAKKTSAIDDGLDTFREFPRNIVVSDFKIGSNYYTFNYDIRFASWVEKFNIIKVCELNEIGKSSKKILDLNDFDAVLVESPGVEALQLFDLKFARVLVVKHSNPNKSIKALQSYSSSIGSDFALEKSIENFRGTLIVGESMTAVFALMLKSPAFKLVIAIQRDNKKNLASLVQVLNIKKHAMLWHAGYNIFDVKKKIIK
jgi:predicted Fe-Mo cluster-binding NifX family protein